MCVKGRSIYQISRKRAGFTQEKAAQLLKISIETIRAYESNKPDKSKGKIPEVPVDIVMEMAELYKDPMLELKHLSYTNPIFRKHFGIIDDTTFEASLLRFQNELNHVNGVIQNAIEVGCDGIIQNYDLPKWQPVEKEIKDNILAGLVLMVTAAKAKATCAATQMA